MSPMKLFKFLLSLLVYLFATLIWFSEIVPVLFESASDFELIFGVFGICLWLIVTACLLSYASQNLRNRAPQERK